MALNTSALKPGFIVNLKTSIAGNVSYTKKELEAEHVTTDGAQLARWETERLIMDAAEHDEAIKARSAARSAIIAVCANTSFGLMCPEEKTADLEAAIGSARRIADAFNALATLSKINIYVMVGRIVPDDVEAMRAINSEVRDLLQQMENGLKNLDVKSIREAANKAKGLGSMLTPAAAERVQEAIDLARSVARKINKAGEAAAQEVDLKAIEKITNARVSFLDLDSVEGDVSVPEVEGRSLDFIPDALDDAGEDVVVDWERLERPVLELGE